MYHGFLIIDKPAGITSHDVVARIRRISGQRQVGHAGTLDPAATGVLVVALGGATRLIEYVQDETAKRYLATVALGVVTTTDDAEGSIMHQAAVPDFGRNELEALLAQFQGDILQIPPMYSALHHDGKRMYELARAGQQIERAPRPVHIERIELVGWQASLLNLDIVCGKGTYIRSLARDIGEAAGCGAHLQALRRTAVGAFTLDDAVALDQLGSERVPARAPHMPAVMLAQAVRAPEIAVLHWPQVILDDIQLGRVRNGQLLDLPELDRQGATRARAHDASAVLAAVLERREAGWHPAKVFNW